MRISSWILTVAGLVCFFRPLAGQDTTETGRVREIFDAALTEGQCYHWLETMAHEIGPRLSGSSNAAAAVSFTKHILDTLGLDSVWLQPCTVPHWVRGEKEQTRAFDADGDTVTFHSIALGNSVGSGPLGVQGEVLQVLSLDALRAYPEEFVRGKVVFFNRPMDQKLISTFRAYGGAVDQRYSGPQLAAEKGAVAAVVRSMSTANDTFPHTGSTRYTPEGPNIPAVAISTVDADILTAMLEKESVRISVRTMCQWLDSVPSFNVIGQINGSRDKDQIILVGGHLDSWDVGHGAHDDGSGCVQSMETLRLLREIGYVPRNTIRCVLFMNEENGTMGAKAYAKASDAAGDFHLAAIESDAGGFRPLAFSISAQGTLQDAYFSMIAPWQDLLTPYGIAFVPGGGGADIGPLGHQGGMLIGLRPVSQRYFDYHHSNADTIDKVNPRELKLGAAAMASLVMILDTHAIRLYE